MLQIKNDCITKRITKRSSQKGQAVVEVALFATILLTLSLVAFDLASQVGKGQALASVAREAARAYVSVKGTATSDEADASAPFEAAYDIAMNMVAPGDFADRENAKHNDSWNIFVNVVKRIDSNGSIERERDEDGDGIVGEEDDLLVIDDSGSFPASNSNYKSRFVTEKRVIRVDGVPTTFDVIKNPENYNLSTDFIGYLQTIVAVEVFQEVDMITGLDQLVGWSDFNQLYEVAYY
ncbi:MAG: TadE family protein [Verrucomicrobiota bacterium]